MPLWSGSGPSLGFGPSGLWASGFGSRRTITIHRTKWGLKWGDPGDRFPLLGALAATYRAQSPVLSVLSSPAPRLRHGRIAPLLLGLWKTSSPALSSSSSCPIRLDSALCPNSSAPGRTSSPLSFRHRLALSIAVEGLRGALAKARKEEAPPTRKEGQGPSSVRNDAEWRRLDRSTQLSVRPEIASSHLN